MKGQQLSFDFGCFTQDFIGKVRVLFDDPVENGRPKYEYYIKKNHHSQSRRTEWGVWKRTYATVEVDWDYIMLATTEQAKELERAGYAEFW